MNETLICVSAALIRSIASSTVRRSNVYVAEMTEAKVGQYFVVISAYSLRLKCAWKYLRSFKNVASSDVLTAGRYA